MTNREPLHSRIVGTLVEAMYHGGATLGELHPGARPERHGVVRHDSIAYRRSGLGAHHLDVYRPQQAESAPVVFYVHGGGFRFMTRRTHWLMGLAFARKGYVTVNIDYRLAPEHPFPAALVDTCHAYQWVCQNIGEYGGNPSEIIVAGESAGANLALNLALASCQRRTEAWMRRVYDCGTVPRAAILACGILEVRRPRRFRRNIDDLPEWLYHRIAEVSRDYLGPSPLCDDTCLQLADPLCVLEALDAPDRPLPPVFAPCGTADPLLDDTRRLERALQRLDVPVDARYYDGEVHAFHALLWRQQARQCWRHIYDFLDDHAPVSR